MGWPWTRLGDRLHDWRLRRRVVSNERLLDKAYARHQRQRALRESDRRREPR